MISALQSGPITATIYSGSKEYNNYKTGIISGPCSGTNDHQIVIVGYNTSGSMPYWICRNSYSTRWGDKGYFKIKMSDGMGQCNINKVVQYPSFK